METNKRSINILNELLEKNYDAEKGYRNAVSESSTLSNLHRSWINLKSSVSPDKDEAIIDECIRGEEAALKDYNKALKSNSLDDSSESLLEEHREEIIDAISELEGLEEADELL